VSSFVAERLSGSSFSSCFLTVYSHVAKTGDIKDFVIIEESGIAKGIRRITAVTGHEAQDVTRLAQALKARLDQLELLSGQEKDSGLKALSVVRSPYYSANVNRSRLNRNLVKPIFRLS
jgi:alanyl-tRNA synthetase